MNISKKFLENLVELKKDVEKALPLTSPISLSIQVRLDTLVEDLSERHEAEVERLKAYYKKRAR